MQLCANRVCNVCAEPVNADGIGYDEENYRVEKCPGGGCKKKEDGQTGDKARKKGVGSTSTGKRVTSICVNISARFPENSCKVLGAFSIFDVDVLQVSPSSPSFRARMR